MSDEAPTSKRCTKCGETKPLEDFYKSKVAKSGYESHCKACVSQRGKKRYAANAEAICKHQREYRASNIEMLREREAESRRLYMRKYRQANAEKIKEWRRVRRAANPDRFLQIQKVWRDTDSFREYRRKYTAAYRVRYPEKFLEYGRRYREVHGEKMRAYMRRYVSEHLEANRAKGHRRRACMNGNGGNFTAQQISEMRIAQAGICAYCERQHDPDHLHIDHIIPISQGGSNDISNICLACPTCNYSKGDRTPDEWVNRWYLRKDVNDQ